MRSLGLSLLSIVVVGAATARAQSPAPAEPTQPVAPAPQASGDVAVDPEMSAAVPTDPAHRTGFTTGLRLGVGIALGRAGEADLGGVSSDVQVAQRDLSDLTSWRAPVWLDVGYSFSGAFTVGAYAQVGVGGNGDACVGDCDWSDIRVGAQAELRLLPGAPVDPWLGVGLGYEWLSYRQLVSGSVPDAQGELVDINVRATETFGGPELLLQGGIDFQVEDALRVGPYASATLGQYLTDSYSCQPSTPACPSGSSVEGAAFHSWIGFGLRGAYTP
jgi:hypothetical protein